MTFNKEQYYKDRMISKISSVLLQMEMDTDILKAYFKRTNIDGSDFYKLIEQTLSALIVLEEYIKALEIKQKVGEKDE
jgi:uncharacterized membrane protein (DUF373 family)